MNLFGSWNWQASRQIGEIPVFDDPPRTDWAYTAPIVVEEEDFDYEYQDFFFVHVDDVTPPPPPPTPTTTQPFFQTFLGGKGNGFLQTFLRKFNRQY